MHLAGSLPISKNWLALGEAGSLQPKRYFLQYQNMILYQKIFLIFTIQGERRLCSQTEENLFLNLHKKWLPIIFPRRRNHAQVLNGESAGAVVKDRWYSGLSSGIFKDICNFDNSLPGG